MLIAIRTSFPTCSVYLKQMLDNYCAVYVEQVRSNVVYMAMANDGTRNEAMLLEPMKLTQMLKLKLYGEEQ